jgi:hypothetical protein
MHSVGSTQPPTDDRFKIGDGHQGFPDDSTVLVPQFDVCRVPFDSVEIRFEFLLSQVKSPTDTPTSRSADTALVFVILLPVFVETILVELCDRLDLTAVRATSHPLLFHYDVFTVFIVCGGATFTPTGCNASFAIIAITARRRLLMVKLRNWLDLTTPGATFRLSFHPSCLPRPMQIAGFSALLRDLFRVVTESLS